LFGILYTIVELQEFHPPITPFSPATIMESQQPIEQQMRCWLPIPSNTQRLILHKQTQSLKETAIALKIKGKRYQPEFRSAVELLLQTCQEYHYHDATSRLDELVRLIRQPNANVGKLHALWRHLRDAMIEQIDVANKYPRTWGWGIGWAGYCGTWEDRPDQARASINLSIS
jgi:hypothetical protein